MFKKIVLLSSLVFLMSTFVGKSETMTCLPDCEEDEFQFGVPPRTYAIGSNCSITVYWGWRHACDMYWDVIITALEYNGSGCSSMTERDMMDAAMLMLLQDGILQTLSVPPLGPQSFPLPENPGDCEYSWRVNKWSCWKKYVTTYGSERLVACENDPTVPCCLTWYKLCIDNLGQRVYTVEDEDGPQQPCQPAECKKICDPEIR